MGLTDVCTEDLKRAFQLLIQGELTCPLTPWELARTGLQHNTESMLSTLRGLEAPAVRAVLVAVLAERLK